MKINNSKVRSHRHIQQLLHEVVGYMVSLLHLPSSNKYAQVPCVQRCSRGSVLPREPRHRDAHNIHKTQNFASSQLGYGTLRHWRGYNLLTQMAFCALLTRTISHKYVQTPCVQRCSRGSILPREPRHRDENHTFEAQILVSSQRGHGTPRHWRGYNLLPNSLQSNHLLPINTLLIFLVITTILGYVPTASGQVEICELFPIALHLNFLTNASSGDVIPDVLNGSQSGNFGWLTWAGSPGTPTLTHSLTSPGDSGSYINPDFPTDHIPSVGNWIRGKPGVSNSKKVRKSLDLLKTIDIKVPVWDQVRGQGANTDYRIFSFALIRILDYQLPGRSRISARFLGFVTCGDQNFAPIVNAGGDQAITLPDPITLIGSVTDDGLPSGASVTTEWSLVDGPTSVNFGDKNSFITSATFSDAGDYKIRLIASDSELTANDEIVITVNQPNAPPQAKGRVVTTLEDTAVDIQLQGSDPDDDALSFTIGNQPGFGSLSGVPPNVQYIPIADYHGSDAFTFIVNDGELNSEQASIQIKITPVNDPPTAEPQTISTIEDTVTPVNIVLSGADIDGDGLAFNIVDSPANGILGGIAPNLSYTPNPEFNGLDSFSFVVNDRTVNSEVTIVDITVDAINDPPVANNLNVSTLEDSPVDLIVTASDVDGDTPTFTIPIAPVNGSLTGIPPNLTYTPNANFNGSDCFIFTSGDQESTSSEATVTINIQPVNDSPIADIQSLSTAEDTPIDVVLTGSDIDDDSLVFAIETPPVNGNLKEEAPNLTYTPDVNFHGTDSFTFVANDTMENSKPATIDITTNSVNDPPIANDQLVMTDEDVSVDLVLTATDVEKDSLTYTIVKPPANGTVIGEPPNINYTPQANFTGTDRFTFIANDGTDDSLPASISVNIDPLNDAPVVENQDIATLEDSAVEIAFSAADVDGDGLSFAIIDSPVHGALSGTLPQITYTPNPNYNGADAFSYKANDGALDSQPAVISITVDAVNDAPEANDQVLSAAANTSVAIILTGSDVDKDPISFTIVTKPLNGSLSGEPPNLTYKSDPNLDSSDSFTFITNDGTLDSAPATVTIKVHSSNAPPVADNQSVITSEETPVVLSLTAADSDGDALTFNIITRPKNGEITGDAPEFTYTPFADFNGTDIFTFVANDGQENSPEAVVTLIVHSVNDAPVANSQSMTTSKGTAMNIALVGSDIDGDVLSYRITSQPKNGILSGTLPKATYTPKANFHGSDTFTFVTNDGVADSSPASVSIIITRVNDPPEGIDQSVSTEEDTDNEIIPIESDSDSDPPMTGGKTPRGNNSTPETTPEIADDDAVDSLPEDVSIEEPSVNENPVADFQSLNTPQNTPIILLLTGSDANNDGISFRILTNPTSGSLEGIAPNLSYTPNTNFNGSDNFTFVVNDGLVDSSVATVTITVDPVNNRPVGNPQNVATDEDTNIVITLSSSDVENDALTFAIANSPTNGALSGSPPDLTYTPNADFNGLDRFTFTANDGSEDSLPVSITINVNAVNDSPTANDQSVETAEDTSIALTLTAADNDKDDLIFEIISPPENGNLTGVAPNITYTPNLNFHGADTISFLVNDGVTNSPPATVSPGNDAPVATTKSVSGVEDTAVSFTLIGVDIDKDTLSFTIFEPPQNGSLAGIPPDMDYTPNPDFTGKDSFTFIVNDGFTNSMPATISINVQPVNDSPVAHTQSFSTSENTPLTLLLTGSDADNDSLMFRILTTPTSGSLEGIAPNLTYTPYTNFNGPDDFTFLVNDGALDSSAATVTITVNSINNRPVGNPQNAATAEDSSIGITLSASDVENDPLSFAIASSPTNGILSGSSPDLTYTPDPNFNGLDKFTFTANDGGEESLPVSITINVTAVNDSPTANHQSVETEEHTPIAITLTAADIDADDLTFEITSPPANGNLTGVAPDITYTPNFNFNGTDTILFLVNDGSVDSPHATVSIVVTPVNNPPEAKDLAVNISEDNIDFAFVLPATDPEASALTFTVVTPPQFGKLKSRLSQPTSPLTMIPSEVVYTPDPDFNGADGFTFIANDGKLDSRVASVNIVIQPVNDPPVAEEQTINISKDIPTSITLDATDIDGDPLSFLMVTQPRNGKLNGMPPNLAYTSNPYFNGTDSFTFKVNDGELDSASAKVTINVKIENDQPTITSIPVTWDVVGQPYTYEVKVRGPDPNNVLTFSLDNAPTGMNIDPKNGLIT